MTEDSALSDGDLPSKELPSEDDVMAVLRGVIDPELGSNISQDRLDRTHCRGEVCHDGSCPQECG